MESEKIEKAIKKVNMYLTDPKTGKKSVTLTLLIVTFIVALIKVLISGMEFNGSNMGQFSAADFMTMVGGVGAIYGFRKHSDKDKE